VLFVKLWQFDPNDRTEVRIDTGKGRFVAAHERPGVQIVPLFHAAHEDVRLERWAPQAQIELPVPGGAEFLVLDGRFEEGGESFTIQSWLRLPASSVLRAKAGPEGCRVWLKADHLAKPPTFSS
jgi:hypothetical protein